MITVAEYKARRAKLVESVRQKGTDGVIVLFGALESDGVRFRQESSFYYFTGVQEPGSVLVLALDGFVTLYIPNHGSTRSVWMVSDVEPTDACAQQLGVDTVVYAGEQGKGYQIHPFFTAEQYRTVIDVLSAQRIYTLCPHTPYGYVEPRYVLMRYEQFVSGLSDKLVDISSEVGALRRTKSLDEIALMCRAIDITRVAQEYAVDMIEPGGSETEVYAAIEYAFLSLGASRAAFPSIVASGRNGTVLHYHKNSGAITAGDLVVVDIGAEYGYYAADITRTYPASGIFSARQKEIYSMVLQTQELIAEIAAPGYWLNNPSEPDQSLHHIAHAFLKEQGYAQYFPHGIGHFLGLDVHDVGDARKQLQPGDVITIEPGIYIPQESIGVRIEDNYWIVQDGAVCLSQDIPKGLEDIERLCQE